jgi:adenosylmethionine-8-amino-7-oxononanoate aminotransferase
MAKKTIERSLKHLWHPCTQMKKYETYPPMLVQRAFGSTIELCGGQKLLDAISSWWCKSLGHHHPRLQAALLKQLQRFEHVMLADMTFDTITALSEQLSDLAPPLNKAFYASDGTCAVEIAIKMSLQSRLIAGEKERSQFIALSNGYHGDTSGALSLCDIDAFRAPYEKVLFKPYFLNRIPYVLHDQESLYHDCSQLWPDIESKLKPYAASTTAFVLEPMIQGAGGMKMYSADFLYRLRQWTQKNNIHLIADEIMTGMGRTGKMLACEHADITPDFVCLSKGLTSGSLPLSVVLTHDDIYQHFYSDEKKHTFLHSHTYSGNALAIAIALETLKIIKEERLVERAQTIGKYMLDNMRNIANTTKKLDNVRGLGAITAADVKPEYLDQHTLQDVCRYAIEKGVLLRPLGHTIYWLPPLNIATKDLNKIISVTTDAISNAI